jgi:hypothetical protein
MDNVMNAIANGLAILGGQGMQKDMLPSEAAPASKEAAAAAPPAAKDAAAPATPPAAKDETAAATPPATKDEPPKFEPYELMPKEKGLLGADELKPLQELFVGSKVPKEVAEKVHDYVEGVTRQTIEAANQVIQQRVQKWDEQLRKDPEIMNEYGKNTELVRRYLAVQSPGFVDALKETGLLSHPSVVKYLIKQGASIADDSSTGFNSRPSVQASLEKTVANVYKGLM